VWVRFRFVKGAFELQGVDARQFLLSIALNLLDIQTIKEPFDGRAGESASGQILVTGVPESSSWSNVSVTGPGWFADTMCQFASFFID